MDIMTITYHWLRHTLVGVMLLLPTAVSTAYSVQHTPYSVQRTAYSVLSSQWYAAHVEPRTPYAPLPIYSECCGYECCPRTYSTSSIRPHHHLGLYHLLQLHRAYRSAYS